MKNLLLTILSLSFIICCIPPQVRMDKKPDGIFTDYYENGKKKEEGNYKYISYEKQLEKDGQWIYWDIDGEKIRQETYIDGEKTSMDIFKDGKIIISKSWGTLDF